MKKNYSKCNAEEQRTQLHQDIDDWYQHDPYAVRTPKVVWRSLLRDAGLKVRDLTWAPKDDDFAPKGVKYLRREIRDKLFDHLDMASDPQICGYARQRSSAISRDIWGYGGPVRKAAPWIIGGGVVAAILLLAGKAKASVNTGTSSGGVIPQRIQDMLENAAFNIFGSPANDPRIMRALLAITWQESQGNPAYYVGDVQGSKGCNDACVAGGPSVGPMQVWQRTAVNYKLWYPSSGQPFTQAARDEYVATFKNDEEAAIDLGVRTFKKKLAETGGSNYVLAIRNYNGSDAYRDRAVAWATKMFGPNPFG